MDGPAADSEPTADRSPGEERQPSLFDSLPGAAPAGKRARRSRSATADPAASAKGGRRKTAPPAPSPAPAPPPAALEPSPLPPLPGSRTAAATAALDPAALSNPELKDLLRALPDLRLSFLMVEAAREWKRRVAPGDEEGPSPEPPNPSLLRAARLVVGELSGEED